MLKKGKQGWALIPAHFRLLLSILLLLGIFFRFSNLEHYPYWRDEAYTSLRISGYTQAELVQQVFDGHVISAADLQKYQNPVSTRNFQDTISSLAIEDSQHPPLYYVILHFWVRWFGSSVAVMRCLSALISLLAFPCIYWLCLELFKSPLVGWVAMVLIAVSPFHIYFAQQAREYSLWTVIILLSSAALLRAIRVNTKLSWMIYAITMILGLYTYPFSILVMISHCIYIFANKSWQFLRRNKSYFLASFVAIISFLPWILVMAIHLKSILLTTYWATQKLNFSELLELYIYNIGYNFINPPATSYFLPALFIIYPILLVTLIVSLYSLYVIIFQAPKQAGLFIVPLIAVTWFALWLPDLILGGQRSTVEKYLTPCYLGIELATAYLLAAKITFPISKRWGNRVWNIIGITIIYAGILTYGIDSLTEGGLNTPETQNISIAHTFNQVKNPLLISDAHIIKVNGIAGIDGSSVGHILSLSHLFKSNVKIQLVIEPNLPKIPDGFSNVFLFNPSDSLQNHLQEEYGLTLIQKDWLWKISVNSPCG